MTASILPRSSALKVSVICMVAAVAFAGVYVLGGVYEAQSILLSVSFSIFAALFAIAGTEQMHVCLLWRRPLIGAAFLLWLGLGGFLVFTEGLFTGFLQFCALSILPFLVSSGTVVWAHAFNKINTAQSPSRTDGAQRYAAALVLVVMLGIFGPWQVSQIVMDRGDIHLAKNEMDAYYADINKAGKLSGQRNPRALMAAASVPLGIVFLNAPLMDKADLQKIYEQGKDLLDRAALQDLRRAEIYYLQAELLGAVERFLKLEPPITQEDYLRTALVLDPEYFPARVMLSKIIKAQGEKEQAYQIMLDGMDLPYKNSNPATYYQQLTIMVQEMGDAGMLGRVGEIVLRREMARRMAEKP